MQPVQMEQQMPSSLHNARRAITPSPEKAAIGNTRRAITPTPNRNVVCSDYQNLSVIQNKIFNGNAPIADDPGYVTRKGMEQQQQQQQQLSQQQYAEQYAHSNNGDVVDGVRSQKDCMMNGQMLRKPHLNLHRSLSAESTQLQDGLSIPEHLNQPRRRDSGNWSGDRNSASSSSSTTLEGSYLYLMGKRNGSHPPSPTRTTQNGNPAQLNGHHQFFDAGYDSYSLSSTDSYPPKHHNQQLAKIPESVVLSGDCERLCMEADTLLEKSRYSEDIHDLETALVLCNTAAVKTRKAMDAPYSNPHTMTFARMKHNSCVMRARSLHRRLLIEKGGCGTNFDAMKETQYVSSNDMRSIMNNGSLRHMRQNSKDGLQSTTSQATKSIEIYATLPKKGKSPLKLIENEDAIEPDIQPLPLPQAKPERESRTLSIFGRRGRSEDKEKHARSRSEDRNKHARELTVVGEPLLANAKDTLKKHKEDKDEKCEKEKTNKKQHKVRRKILMGGLIRRKNRSMPDLTEANAQEAEKELTAKAAIPIKNAIDDSSLGLGVSNASPNSNSMSGYLSEGHFEYQTIITGGGNPNLERSKLMRKNVQNGIATRQQLTQVKVPPPPPLRTNSTLSQHQLQLHQQQMDKELMPMSVIQPYDRRSNQANVSLISNMSSNTSMSEDSCQTIILTTAAVVHQEQSPLQSKDTVDEVDSRNLELPPYPSPPASSCHSRQASEDFPPPPNEILDSTSIIEPMSKQSTDKEGTTSILAQLQQRQQMLKQQKMRLDANGNNIINQINTENWLNDQKSVKDLASRFEQVKLPHEQQQIQQQQPTTVQQMQLLRLNSSSQEILNGSPMLQRAQIRTNMSGLIDSNARPAIQPMISNSTSSSEIDEVDCAPAAIHKNPISKSSSIPYLTVQNKTSYELPASQIAEEIREVEMLNNVVHQTLHNGNAAKTQERTKKKSVSFCDQVILVATADDDEDQDFIPNPILERVLRTANYSNGNDVVDSVIMQQQQQNILKLQSEPSTTRQQIIVPLQGSSNENGYRQDVMRSEAQKVQQMIMQQQQQQQRAMQINVSPVPAHIADTNSLPKNLNGNHAYQQIDAQRQYPIQSQFQAPITQQNQQSPMMHPLNGQPQARPLNVTNANFEMNGHLSNSPQPSPYMQVPSMNYVKANQRPPNFNMSPQSTNNYLPTTNGMPITTNAGNVYQMPPITKYLQHQQQQQMHQQMNGNFPPQPSPQMYQMPQMSPTQATAYQRIPHTAYAMQQQQQQQQAQQYFPPNQMVNGAAQKVSTGKKVSFEPGTKGETIETAKPVASVTNDLQTNGMPSPTTENQLNSSMTVTAIPTRVFNNSAIVKKSAKAVQCNLCRKKHVIAPAIYCSDCEFYMSRFQPRA